MLSKKSLLIFLVCLCVILQTCQCGKKKHAPKPKVESKTSLADIAKLRQIIDNTIKENTKLKQTLTNYHMNDHDKVIEINFYLHE